MTYDYPVTYRPDLLKVLARGHYKDDPSVKAVDLSKDLPKDKGYVNAQRKAQARWLDYTSGNAYVLYVQNRTSDHSFRVIKHGKNVYQAVRKYYRGFTQAQDNWIWQCTKVVAVYTMLDNGMTTSGDLLCGQAQDSYPY